MKLYRCVILAAKLMITLFDPQKNAVCMFGGFGLLRSRVWNFFLRSVCLVHAKSS